MVMKIREMELREMALAEGRAEGKILGAVEILREEGKDNKEILGRIMAKYHLSEEEAKEYLQVATT